MSQPWPVGFGLSLEYTGLGLVGFGFVIITVNTV